MRFACDSCGAQYMIADEKVGARGVKVKCKKCGNMIIVKPQAEASAEGEADTSTAGAAPEGATEGAGAETQGALGGAFQSMFASEQTDTQTSVYSPEQLAALKHESGSAPAQEPEAAGNGAESSAAFGFGDPNAVRTGSSGGETDFALSSLEKRATESAASSRPAGEKEWYVAIEDSQVGPIDVAEIEQRWDGKELDEDTLVWKAGMGDWIALADAPELSYLITERPQSKPAASQPYVARGSAGAASSISSSLSSSLGPASFGASAEESADEPTWRPSAATALSSLVQEELVAKKPEAAKPEQSSVPQGMEGLGIPSLGAADIFGSGAGGNGAAVPSFAAPSPQPDAFAAGGGGWSVPEPRRSGGGTGLKIAVGAMAVVVLGLGGFVAYMFVGRTETPPATAALTPAVPPVAPTPAAPPAAPAPQAAAEEGKGEATAEAKPEQPEAKPEKGAESSKTADKGKASDKGTKAGRGEVADAGKKTKGGKTPKPDNDPDSLFDKTPPAAEVKASLTKDDIVSGVKANGAKLGPCLQAARSKNEVPAGKYTFVVDWTIQPNGGVSGARLKGPAEVMNTSLPACFARVMGSWKFPASKSGAPISNFPLPITLR